MAMPKVARQIKAMAVTALGAMGTPMLHAQRAALVRKAALRARSVGPASGDQVAGEPAAGQVAEACEEKGNSGGPADLLHAEAPLTAQVFGQPVPVEVDHGAAQRPNQDGAPDVPDSQQGQQRGPLLHLG